MSAMVDGHETVAGKVESRLDRTTLSKWKTETADQVTGDKAKVEGKAVAVLPERSDNVITAALNQWAAEAYPTVQAHLASAKSLKNMLEKRRTTN
jgi:hypothetical protein